MQGDIPGGSLVKNPSTNADVGLIAMSGRPLGGGNGNPVQCCCLNNPMDRWAWWVIVHVVQSLSSVWIFATTWTTAHQVSCPSPSPRACSKSCPLSEWRYPTILSSVIPFSSHLQSLPASGSFLMSQLAPSSIGASASASVLPMNIQELFPLGLTGWISFNSMGLSRVFSNITVWKYQFFSAQPSLWSNSHIHTWLREKS